MNNPLSVIFKSGITGNDKNSDKEYTSNSVFCSHGAGYAVPWDEADKKMHCIIE